MDDVRRRLFELIDQTPNLDWLMLTKRPENIRRFWHGYQWRRGDLNSYGAEMLEDRLLPRDNVWLGCSFSDQATADKLIPELVKCRDLCKYLFVSVEPLLGPVDLQKARTAGCANGARCSLDPVTGHRIIQDSSEGGLLVECECSRLNGIGWVIVGGESGPYARLCSLDFIRQIISQCRDARIPCFVKQIGRWVFNDAFVVPKDKKGADPSEWPEDLRVQQWPGAEGNRDCRPCLENYQKQG